MPTVKGGNRKWRGDGQGQGIGTADTRTPGQDISTPTAGVGTAATRTPGDGQGQGIGTAATREYAAAPQQSQQPIKVMEGVTAGTQQRLDQLNQGYQPGAAAQQAMQQLQQMQANKPGAYASQYVGQMQGILQEITGQKPFQYSISQDNLFQSLSDYYMQQAKQASMNAQGQAAALTGGYGNSAAQAAGSQAYQQAILPMYDKAMDTARFAYDVHQGNQNNRLNQLQALQSMDEMEYGRNRDAVGDWERESGRAIPSWAGPPPERRRAPPGRPADSIRRIRTGLTGRRKPTSATMTAECWKATGTMR